MSRRKRTSRILGKVELRAAGLKAINPDMSFDETRAISNLTALAEQLRMRLDAYNTALSVIDSSKTEIEQLEKTLSDLSEQMLIGVAFQYGKDSVEYEMAGGVRKSDRIRRSSVSRLKSGTEDSTANRA